MHDPDHPEIVRLRAELDSAWKGVVGLGSLDGPHRDRVVADLHTAVPDAAGRAARAAGREAVVAEIRRFADLDVAGTTMRAGQRLFLLLVSANHDEREFPDPERFDVRRPFPRTLVFGHGTHFCIGAHVARLEWRVVLEELLARIPDYEIDATGIAKTPSEFQIGYLEMPVRC